MHLHTQISLRIEQQIMLRVRLQGHGMKYGDHHEGMVHIENGKELLAGVSYLKNTRSQNICMKSSITRKRIRMKVGICF